MTPCCQVGGGFSQKKQNKKVHNIAEGRFLGCHIMWKSG